MRSHFPSIFSVFIGVLLGTVLATGLQASANTPLPSQAAKDYDGGFGLPGSGSGLQPLSNSPNVSGTGDNLPVGQQNSQPKAVNASSIGQMNYQGRLLQNGNPYNGNISITFRLYQTPSGGVAFWTETQAVTVDNGLFSVMLGAVNPLNPYAATFVNQVYLGIQPAGAAAELTPRQPLSAVGYAYSLVPGATIHDGSPAGNYTYDLWVNADNHRGIMGRSSYTDAVGIEGDSYGAYKTTPPVGVSGYSQNGYGVQGYSSSATGVGVYGKGSTGVYGTGVMSDTIGVYGFTSASATHCSTSDPTCAAAINGVATSDSYASRFNSKKRSAIIVQSAATNYWDIWDHNDTAAPKGGISTTGPLYVGGDLTVAGSKAGYIVDIALNASAQPLEQGDVVAIVGFDQPVIGQIPVVKVDKASAANATSVMGVVDVLYTPCDKPEAELQSGEKCGGFDHATTTIQPGQYLSVVTLGAFGYLKVDASNGPIKPGDLVTVSSTTGYTAKAMLITVNGASFYAPGTIVGKAMGSLDSGAGVIPVFVSVR